MTRAKKVEKTLAPIVIGQRVAHFVKSATPAHKQGDLLKGKVIALSGIAETEQAVIELDAGGFFGWTATKDLWIAQRSAQSGNEFFEEQGADFYTSPRSETYWCS